MRIFLREMKEAETFLKLTQEEPWVLKSVLQTDEKIDQKSTLIKENSFQSRPIQVDLSLRKVDEIFIISGKIDTFLKLICSRCACTFDFPCAPQFSALFCKDPVLAGIAHINKNALPFESNRPIGQNQGFARHAHDPQDDLDIAQGKDLDITYLSQDFIDLGDVLAEQLQLQVPFQPLCQETCQGLCSSCGNDLNVKLCTCTQISQNNPFSVLGDFNS